MCFAERRNVVKKSRDIFWVDRASSQEESTIFSSPSKMVILIASRNSKDESPCAPCNSPAGSTNQRKRHRRREQYLTSDPYSYTQATFTLRLSNTPTRISTQAQHTRAPFQPAAMAFVPYGFVLVRVRVRSSGNMPQEVQRALHLMWLLLVSPWFSTSSISAKEIEASRPTFKGRCATLRTTSTAFLVSSQTIS